MARPSQSDTSQVCAYFDVDRGAVVGGADAARQKSAVVAGVVPGKSALIAAFLPKASRQLDGFDGFLAVQDHSLAISLDLLAAPGPQIWIPPGRRISERVPGGLAAFNFLPASRKASQVSGKVLYPTSLAHLNTEA